MRQLGVLNPAPVAGSWPGLVSWLKVLSAVANCLNLGGDQHQLAPAAKALEIAQKNNSGVSGFFDVLIQAYQSQKPLVSLGSNPQWQSGYDALTTSRDKILQALRQGKQGAVQAMMAQVLISTGACQNDSQARHQALELLRDSNAFSNPTNTAGLYEAIAEQKKAELAQQQVRSAFAATLQQARSANEQLTSIQSQVAKLQAEAQALTQRYQQQVTGGVSARGKLSVTAAKLETVLQQLRTLYSQANAPVAALKQATAQMQQIRAGAAGKALAPETVPAQRQVTQWAKAGDGWRAGLNANINNELARFLKEAYSGLHTLGARVTHTNPRGSSTGTAADAVNQREMNRKAKLLESLAQQAYDKLRTGMNLGDFQDYLRQLAETNGVSDAALKSAVRSFLTTKLQGLQGGSGVRASVVGGGGGSTSDMHALEQALQELDEASLVDDPELDSARKIARQIASLTNANFSPQLLEKLAQAILQKAKELAGPGGDVLSKLTEMFDLQGGAFSTHVRPILEKLLGELQLGSDPVRQSVLQQLQKQWGWRPETVPHNLLEALCERVRMRINVIVQRELRQTATELRLGDGDTKAIEKKLSQDALRDLQNFLDADIVSSALAELLLPSRGGTSFFFNLNFRLRDDFNRWLEREREPLLDSQGHPTSKAVELLRNRLIWFISDLSSKKNDDPRNTVALNRLREHIGMFSDRFTLGLERPSLDASGNQQDSVLVAYGSDKVWKQLLDLWELLEPTLKRRDQESAQWRPDVSPVALIRWPEIQTWMERVANEWERFSTERFITNPHLDVDSYRPWTGIPTNDQTRPALPPAITPR